MAKAFKVVGAAAAALTCAVAGYYAGDLIRRDRLARKIYAHLESVGTEGVGW